MREDQGRQGLGVVVVFPGEQLDQGTLRQSALAEKITQTDDAGALDRHLQHDVGAVGGERAADLDLPRLAVHPHGPDRLPREAGKQQAGMSPEVVRVDRSTMGRTIKRAGRDDPPDGPEANGDEVGQRFDPSEAGRAIAFFNLLLFVGVFLWQWGFGVMVSALSGTYGTEAAYRLALGALALLSAVGYVAFVALPGKRPRAARDPAASPRAEGGTIR